MINDTVYPSLRTIAFCHWLLVDGRLLLCVCVGGGGGGVCVCVCVCVCVFPHQKNQKYNYLNIPRRFL